MLPGFDVNNLSFFKGSIRQNLSLPEGHFWFAREVLADILAQPEYVWLLTPLESS
jgi:hypothetical protein